MTDFSRFLAAKSCEVPSLILLPWQQLKIQRTGLTCKMCLKGVSLKSESFSLIPWAVLGWWRKNRRGAYFAPNPGKIGLPRISIQLEDPKITNLLWLKCWPVWKTKMFENTYLYRIRWRKHYLGTISCYLTNFQFHLYNRSTLRSDMYYSPPQSRSFVYLLPLLPKSLTRLKIG